MNTDSASTIADILRSSKTVAVVGLSDKPERASGHVAQYLQQQGYRIVPVNPNLPGQQILGEPVYASLQEAADALAKQGRTIDVVDCFRNSEQMDQVARDAVQVRAGSLWMQLGVVNQGAADVARAAGLKVVMDRCMKIEHAMLESA
jgi:predicted CoA-binding protein